MGGLTRYVSAQQTEMTYRIHSSIRGVPEDSRMEKCLNGQSLEKGPWSSTLHGYRSDSRQEYTWTLLQWEMVWIFCPGPKRVNN